MPYVPPGLLFAILGATLATVLLAAMLLLLAASRSLRRSRGARNFLFLLIGMEVGFAPLIWGGIDLAREERERTRAIADATLHLDAPRTIDGIDFPAGSALHPDPDGTVRWGSVPQATLMKGVPLIGDFRLGPLTSTDPPGGIAMSTLATATVVRGVPCASGPFTLQQDGLRCTLDKDYDFLGHVLMHGEVFETGRPLTDEPIVLKVGTLARPEQLDDAVWPAGTVLGGVSEPADQLRHNPDVVGYPVQLCLKPGAEVTVEGATLHGPLVYSFSHTRRRTDVSCWPLTTFSRGPPKYTDGYVELGGDRFQEGVWSTEKGWLKLR